MKKMKLAFAAMGLIAVFSAFATTKATTDLYKRIAPGTTDASFQLIVGEKGDDWFCVDPQTNICNYLKIAANDYDENEVGTFE